LLLFGVVVRSWIGIVSAELYCVLEHFLQFVYSASGLRARCSLCSLFDFVVFGSCGIKGIVELSKITKVSSISR